MYTIDKSYFQRNYFKQERLKLSCLFWHDTERENYQIIENGLKTSLSSPKVKYGTSWLAFYDSQQDGYTVNELYSKVENFLELSECLEPPCIQKYLNEYRALVEYHPFFLMYFGLVYQYLNKMIALADFSKEKHTLCEYLKELLAVYLEQMNYIKATLIEPYNHSGTVCTGKSIAAHEKRLCCLGQSSPYLPNDFHIEHILPDNVVDDYTFSQEFIGGIDHFIENNLILRQCPVCKGYFKTKTTSDTTFCNRLYKGNSTCQIIGAHKNYKEKIKQDVIYSEYRKFYYKLHSQIRRGTRDKDSAYFEELKKLQEIYNEKYTNAPEEQKKSVLEEFKKKINSLYE